MYDGKDPDVEEAEVAFWRAETKSEPTTAGIFEIIPIPTRGEVEGEPVKLLGSDPETIKSSLAEIADDCGRAIEGNDSFDGAYNEISARFGYPSGRADFLEKDDE